MVHTKHYQCSCFFFFSNRAFINRNCLQHQQRNRCLGKYKPVEWLSIIKPWIQKSLKHFFKTQHLEPRIETRQYKHCRQEPINNKRVTEMSLSLGYNSVYVCRNLLGWGKIPTFLWIHFQKSPFKKASEQGTMGRRGVSFKMFNWTKIFCKIFQPYLNAQSYLRCFSEELGIWNTATLIIYS